MTTLFSILFPLLEQEVGGWARSTRTCAFIWIGGGVDGRGEQNIYLPYIFIDTKMR